MKTALTRLCLALLAVAGLSACTVIPAHPAAYRGNVYYGQSHYDAYPYGRQRHYDDRYYRDSYRAPPAHYYDAPPRHHSPVTDALRLHRDVRRSLGLPRLPGMP